MRFYDNIIEKKVGEVRMEKQSKNDSFACGGGNAVPHASPHCKLRYTVGA